MDEKEPWHLDRRIPVATLFVLAVQLVVMSMWFNQLRSDVNNHSALIAKMELDAENRESDSQISYQQHEARIRSVELAQASQSSDLRSIQIGINRIETKLENISP